MTCLFNDIKEEDNLRKTLAMHRPPGPTFDEVLFAGDSLIFSDAARTRSQFLRAIEVHSKKYGMQLNYDRCKGPSRLHDIQIRATIAYLYMHIRRFCSITIMYWSPIL